MASRTSPLGWTAEARDPRAREDDAVPRLAVPLLAVLALLAPTSAAIGTSGTSGTTIPSTGTSCVSGPLRSGYAFTSTVASTSADGRDVQAVSSSNPQPNPATSVDRSSATGTRYEFRPLSPASPYEDDLCTATHEVAAAAPPEPPATTVSTGAFVTALVALGVVALVGTAAAFLVPSRRRRNRRRRRRA